LFPQSTVPSFQEESTPGRIGQLESSFIYQQPFQPTFQQAYQPFASTEVANHAGTVNNNVPTVKDLLRFDYSPDFNCFIYYIENDYFSI
jgi:hypothetical protein